MGLSSKQVSSNRDIDWNQTLLQDQNLELPKSLPMKKQQQQQQTQQSEAVKCPRCDSTNTKFCYYNNYNKSQPRHYCRACKRHWTKGGTLRNVPVGGGRKNKRLKKSTPPTSINTSTNTTINTTTKTSISTTPTTSNTNMDADFNTNMTKIQTSHQKQNLSEFGIGNGMFLSTSMPFTQNQSFLFPFSNSTSFDTNTCAAVSTSLKSSNNVYNYGEEFKTMEDSNINSVIPSTSGGNITQPWEMPATSNGMEMSNYWSWEDIDSLVSTDLNVPWDDSDIKP
ncbi:uncharacterized protein [Cicer arietinum]|uniref:Dof zinc finger protein n=1 Tax=Cicer arietinum TaxID=3827 RepID=A0A1S2X9Q9_CICAR|nr:dof zinc finger protein DOF4.7-like [Cicer arietinum]XP_027187277.1 dof zinc finger protein DOF4.7-like [Cicer arietinum]